MDILNTQYPLEQKNTCPTVIIYNHIVNNLHKYSHIDKTLINMSVYQMIAHSLKYSDMQQLINQISKSIKNPVLLFNYDQIDINLQFPDNCLVFTPESTIHNHRLKGIPRNSCVSDNNNDLDRDILFYFNGAYKNHVVREQLIKLFPHCCTGYEFWGLHYHDEQFKSTYVNMLKRSKFSICPRGVGRSSHRLFESMMLGSIPVIISDDWKPPLYDHIDWARFSIHIHSKHIAKIPLILESIPQKLVSIMSANAVQTYKDYFSNQNMYKCFDIEIMSC